MYLSISSANSSKEGWMDEARPGHSARFGQKTGVSGRRESEGGLGLCLDKLSCDLDTEFTTKSRLRALKST